jgi:hypothetical protein
MVVVGEVPSPWGEAAKGFLHIKGVNWVAVRLALTASRSGSGRASAVARWPSTRTNGPDQVGPRYCCWPNG